MSLTSYQTAPPRVLRNGLCAASSASASAVFVRRFALSHPQAMRSPGSGFASPAEAFRLTSRPMRKVIFGVASSLDNYIARPNGAVDWLIWSKDVSAFIAQFWKTIDTVVMGRKTYEVGVEQGAGAYPGLTAYVCSRR